MKTQIEKIADDLFLIPLTPPLAGFNRFISAWLYRGSVTCLIDVGPSATAPQLLQALQELNIDHLDYVLLTHIHLDHAGAIGEIAEAFPHSPIVCHQSALAHLVEPSRLWQGTKKVLGSMALSYGPVKPVAQNRLLEANRFRSEFIAPILTPGHAAHHVSYLTEPYLFAGETGGIYHALPENRYYLRPATPPAFFLEDALQSLDALIDGCPSAICYGHFGIHHDAVKMLRIHRRQLQLWERLIRTEMNRVDEPDRMTACLQRLCKEDSLMAAFDELPRDIQEREKYFLQSSITGYLGYLRSPNR